MLTDQSEITDIDTLEPGVLTKEQSMGMKDRYAEALKAFMATRARNDMLYVGDCSAYVRKSLRYLPTRKYIACLDLANIARESRMMNSYESSAIISSGFLDAWMTAFEQTANRYGYGVYVENVLNEWMPGWLERRGYLPASHDYGIDPCRSYYLELENTREVTDHTAAFSKLILGENIWAAEEDTLRV